MAMTSMHHSFDIDLAAEYSVEEAILIHHFQHWIKVNRTLKRNFIEDRTWTYQTREEIASHFPYFTYKQIRKITEKLVKKGVLLKGNFNKKGFDKTLWYAFKNEEMFMKAQTGNAIAQMGNGSAQMGTPIPHSKTDSSSSSSSDILRNISSSSPKVDAVDKPFSKEITDACESFLAQLRKAKPDYKFNKSQAKKWCQELDRMIRLDKRSPAKIMELLAWVLQDSFWKDKIFKPNPVKYLRDKFDQLEVKMTCSAADKVVDPEQELIKENTRHFYALQKLHPDAFKHCFVKNGYVKNKENDKEAKIGLAKEAFITVLCHIAGVRHISG